VEQIKINGLIDRICPLCKQKENKLFLNTSDFFFTKQDFTLAKCDQCGFIYTNPIPDPDSLATYYESEDYLSHKSDNKGLLSAVYKSIRKINIKTKFRLVQQYKELGNVLEIGTGTGELLYYFYKNGWNVTGVEPNDYARNFAISNFKLNILNEDQISELQAKSYDIVMLWHVLEHVYDLEGRMKQIKKLVKDNGYVVIAVPNIDSYDFKKYGKYWAGLDVPRHLYHFSEPTMRKLLQTYSLKLIASYPMKFDAYYVSLLSEKYLGSKLPYFNALFNGFRSNQNASRNNNYSSMIFVATEY